MTDDQLYLADIFERIEQIESYTQGGREVFLQSPLIQDALHFRRSIPSSSWGMAIPELVTS